MFGSLLHKKNITNFSINKKHKCFRAMLNVKLTILNSMSVLQTNNLCLRNISILKTEGVGEGRSKDRELGGGGEWTGGEWGGGGTDTIEVSKPYS